MFNKNNKRGQANLFKWFIFLIVIILIWIFFLAPHLSTLGLNGVSSNSLTGIEAFFYSNLNLVVGIILLLVIIVGFNQFGVFS